MVYQMNRIKSYNESISSDAWVVICTSYDGDIDEVTTYMTEMSAADHYIKLVNEIFQQDFEPMKEDGERLFSDPNQNEDYLKAIKYVAERRRVLLNNNRYTDELYWPWIYKTKINK